jgi:serine/threonine-protein kinase
MAKGVESYERFRVLQRLGAGAFGKTLLVADREKNDRQVVIKVPHDKSAEKALINELINASALAANLKGLSHPNIVRFLGFDEFEGWYVMIMEYVRGQELRKMIGPMRNARRPMDFEAAMRYFRNACSGLVAAHRINLIHRDIKPDNIIVREEDDVAKLLDLGISTIVRPTSVNALTIAGTAPYMAPEALVGNLCVQSDIWSLSVTLYELLTGNLPFWDSNTDIFHLKSLIDNHVPRPPIELNPAVDRRISDLTMRGLEKDPKARFQTAEEMLSAFFPIDAEVELLRRLFKDGQEAEAESRALASLDRNPSEVALYLLVGEFRNRQHRHLQAEEILRKGLAMRSDHAALHFYLAPVLYCQGKDKRGEAVAVMNKALALDLTGAQRQQAVRLLKSWGKA